MGTPSLKCVIKMTKSNLITREEAARIIDECAEELKRAQQNLCGHNSFVIRPQTKVGALRRAADVLRGKRDSFFAPERQKSNGNL